MAINYLSVAEGRKARGLRLVLSASMPGPWGEAAKAILRLRSVPFTPVAQAVMEANDELREWTGFRNAPIAILDDEPAVAGWLDIVMLAERLGSGPSLLPDDPRDQALCLGFSAQICGPRGIGWCRRLTMLWMMFARAEGTGGVAPVFDAYGVSEQAVTEGPGHIVAILSGFTEQLRRQKAAGSPYLVGTRLSVCDIHWACFSLMVELLPPDMSPFPDAIRPAYVQMEPAVRAAVDPILIEHRDHIFRNHIGLPLEY